MTNAESFMLDQLLSIYSLTFETSLFEKLEKRKQNDRQTDRQIDRQTVQYNQHIKSPDWRIKHF